MTRIFAVLSMTLWFSTAVQAETELSDGAREYVRGAVISTLYHELGHALIDVLNLPVLGQEEDAADVLSVVLAHDLWEEDYARGVAWATALSFQLSSEESNETLYWDTHGPDEQRYYNTVCLFYGADPLGREDFAEEFELPEDRATSCQEEFLMAEGSWSALLDDIALDDGALPSDSLSFEMHDGDSEIAELLETEVRDLNTLYDLPVPVEIRLESCGEVNAFYFAETQHISICTEYVDYLTEQAISADL